MENKYYELEYLIETGEEVHGKFGDIEGTIIPMNIVSGKWITENDSESTK